MAEQIIHRGISPDLELLARGATPFTAEVLQGIGRALDGFRSVKAQAEQATRDVQKLTPSDRADFDDNVEARVNDYWCLLKRVVASVGSANQSYAVLERESNLPEPALRKLGHHCKLAAEEALYALVILGSELNAVGYEYIRLKLAAATETPDAYVSGVEPRGAADEAREEVLRLIVHYGKGLEQRLQDYRDKEHHELDRGALFEAYATSPEPLRQLREEYRDSAGRGGDLAAIIVQRCYGNAGLLAVRNWVADLYLLPISWVMVVSKHARHILRDDYNAEAPKSKVDSLDAPANNTKDSPSLGDVLRDANALDPTQWVIQQEDARERREEEDALRKQVLQLPAKQGEILLDYWQGLREGYRPSAKPVKNSFRQRWGAEYGRRQVMLWRMRKAHPDLVMAVEKAAAGLPPPDACT